MRIYEYLGSRKPWIIMRFTSLISCYPQCLQLNCRTVAYGLQLSCAVQLRIRTHNTHLHWTKKKKRDIHSYLTTSPPTSPFFPPLPPSLVIPSLHHSRWNGHWKDERKFKQPTVRLARSRHTPGSTPSPAPFLPPLHPSRIWQRRSAVRCKQTPLSISSWGNTLFCISGAYFAIKSETMT